ncbi:40S ribosomal protein S7 [Mycena venus]|uniref:40S ribosomal protein S7 n=1 Tax=Mycena venus TaxID=2733690 RepID=A0A8H6Y764_9AGAR|nr:40S ribosomal protein S7 [Mycena venus]
MFKRGFLNKPSKTDKIALVQSLAVATADVDAAEALPDASLSAHLAAVLDISYDRPPNPQLAPFRGRPTGAELTARLSPLFDVVGASGLVPVAVRAAREAWDKYGDGSVAPTEFLRPPRGAAYRIAKIPGKGRGMLASRDLKAGETVLVETPLIVLAEDKLVSLKFLALPKAAIHALLLLHNASPDNRQFSLQEDIPSHRLLDYLKGVASTNAFNETVDGRGNKAGVIVLAGSLFNHSSTFNVFREFDVVAFKQTFTTVSAVKRGEELTVDYNTTEDMLERNYAKATLLDARAKGLMSAANKILRTANAPTTSPDETELSVAQALIDLENNVPELKSELRPLQISAAREVDVRGGKKAIVIFVPVPQLKAFRKVQQRLTRELEKKFSDRHVVFVAQRRMLRKPTRTSRVKQKRPRSRTLTNVHERILEDLVFPTEIVGKRTRVAVDGSKLLKVLLDSKDATSLEYKLDSFSSVYRRLTGKDVVFEFPVVAQE